MQEIVTGEKGKASSFLQNVFDQVTGHANLPDNETFAAISGTNRTLITGARLGGAVFVSLADMASNSLTARMKGGAVTGRIRELAIGRAACRESVGAQA